MNIEYCFHREQVICVFTKCVFTSKSKYATVCFLVKQLHLHAYIQL